MASPQANEVVELLKRQTENVPDSERLAACLSTLVSVLLGFVLASDISEEKLLRIIHSTYIDAVAQKAAQVN